MLSRTLASPTATRRADEKRARIAALKAELGDAWFEVNKAAAERRMARLDAMPEEWRALVHEFGQLTVERHYNSHRNYRRARNELLGRRLDLEDLGL